MLPLSVHPLLQFALTELVFTFARSSGPGGQNVNKVNSKAVLHWNLTESRMPEEWRIALLLRLARYLNLSGCMVIASDRYRDQPKNKADCLEKLEALLVIATTPIKKRKKTKASKSSIRRVKEGKNKRSTLKKMRSKPSPF